MTSPWEGLRQLGITPEDQGLIDRAKKNSDSLVNLGNQGFEAVASKDVPRAIQIVYGTEYETAKASIMGPIAECRRQLERRLTSQATTLAEQASLLSTVAISSLVLSAAATGRAAFFTGAGW